MALERLDETSRKEQLSQEKVEKDRVNFMAKAKILLT